MGVFKRGKVYYISYMVDGRQRKEAVSENRKIAEKALEVRKAEIAQAKYNLVPKKQRIKFKDFANDFMKWAWENKKHEAARRYNSSMKFLLDYFGERPLADIHPFHIEGYKSQRIKNVEGGPVNRDLACLSKMFNLAIKWGRAEKNPTALVEKYREPEGRIRFLSEDEMQLLLENCVTETERLFVILGLGTGMRCTELLALRWSHVNLVDRLIVVGESKNSRVGEIPMTSDVYELLSTVKQRGEYVICKEDGSGYTNFCKSWNNLKKRCGFTEDITPHVLRHTFATLLVRNGVDLRTVMELDRWSS